MKIFLSSTYQDLKDIRKIALNFLDGIVGHVTNKTTGAVVAMEYFSASERSCEEECLHELSTCNLVIGIYGDRYGTLSEDGRSMTEVEFDYALAHNIPVLAFVKREINREENQKRFIADKVYGRKISSANFEDEFDFLNRLNDSLKAYLIDYDGYSIDSLWTQVSSLKEEIRKKIEEGDPSFYLQMLPYSTGEEDLALSNISIAANHLKSFVEDLAKENDAVHSFAYKATYYPERITEKEKSELCTSVVDAAKQILLNWEVIHLAINNHSSTIQLAVAFLKLKRMQEKLLNEKWTEPLRQEVIATREEYLTTILLSKHFD